MGAKILRILKSDPVLTAAWILAVMSAFFVFPDKGYLGYIDWRSLGILWGLMVIIQGLKENSVFDRIGTALIKGVKKDWQLAGMLVFLCFFLSMLITNDVALITFVPFAILILQSTGKEGMILPVVILQTVAANLGSMLTPVGNPQNLYLYGISGMTLGQFVWVMLPYAAASAVMLLIAIFILPQKKTSEGRMNSQVAKEETESQKKFVRAEVLIYLVLFLLALLTVLRLVPWYVLAGVVFLVVLLVDRKILARADYLLLLTFIGFFVFTGNIGRIPQVRDFLQNAVDGREVMVSVLASQLISNVPAALLLAGFTGDYPSLLIGVNIGGLGTLIASMANLISYKAFSGVYNRQRGKYIMAFTVVGLVFLAVLLGLRWVLR